MHIMVVFLSYNHDAYACTSHFCSSVTDAEVIIISYEFDINTINHVETKIKQGNPRCAPRGRRLVPPPGELDQTRLDKKRSLLNINTIANLL